MRALIANRTLRRSSRTSEHGSASRDRHLAVDSRTGRFMAALTPRLESAAKSVAYRVAAARGGRAVHTNGELFLATLHVVDHPMLGVPALDGPGDHDALVRLSRGGSLPKGLPDVLGLAVRLPGAGGAGGDLDLLLASAAWPRWLLFPSGDFASATYSTLLSYQHAGEPLRLLAVAGDRGRKLSANPRLLVKAVAERPVEFVLGVDGADRYPLARLSVHTPLPHGAGEPEGFDPVMNSHPALRPSGWLQEVRAAAYSGSRRGRGAKGEVTATPPRR